MCLRQIIINIAINAIKFTEKGFVRLTVRVEEKDGDDAKKNHKKEGTGLGLSISKQLVELMGGEIGVKSEYGKGSEFYFTVRQGIRSGETVGEDWERAAVMDKDTPEDYQEFTAPGAKILIVDDNEINREVAVLLLEPLQMQTDTAEDGAEALELIKRTAMTWCSWITGCLS